MESRTKTAGHKLALLESVREAPKIFAVKRVIQESPRVKTIVFDGGIEARPGQFVLVWIPRADAKPFGVSTLARSRKEFAVSVACVGPFTKKLCAAARRGLKLGVFGPYGNGFELKGKRICCVAGGYGAAPLLFLASEARKRKIAVTFIEGAKTAGELLFLKQLKKIGVDLRLATDDGSLGLKGFATDAFEAALKQGAKFDCVYSCGPEKMMERILAVCLRKKIRAQFSLDRYIKCGFGLCGQCAVDGLLACKDGPVFSGEQLARVKEFGKTRRNASGARVHV